MRLLRLADDVHIVLYTMHHIISDGWSMGVLLKEVSTLYKALSQNQASPLAELPIQYVDYAVWQRRVAGERKSSTSSYRTGENNSLERHPHSTCPPTIRARPFRRPNGAHVNLRLPEELTRRLKNFSRREGATLLHGVTGGLPGPTAVATPDRTM